MVTPARPQEYREATPSLPNTSATAQVVRLLVDKVISSSLAAVRHRRPPLRRRSAVGPPGRTCLQYWLEQLAFTSATATSIRWAAVPLTLQALTSSTCSSTHPAPIAGPRWV